MTKPVLQNLILGSLCVILSSCGGKSNPASPPTGVNTQAKKAVALSCTLTPSQTTLNSNEIEQEATSIALVATGNVKSVTFNGSPVPVQSSDPVFTAAFPVAPLTNTTYTATVSDGTNTTSCSTAIEVVVTTGPICQIQATATSLTITVSGDVASVTLDVNVTNESDNQFTVSFTQTPGLAQPIDVPFDDTGCMITVNGCCNNAIGINDPSDLVVLTAIIKDANGNPGTNCSTTLP